MLIKLFVNFIKSFTANCIFGEMSYQVFTFKLVFWEGQPSQFPWKLEGSEDGVLAAQRDERGRGQGPVRVDPGPRVSETVLKPRLGAVLTPASEIRISYNSFLLHIDFPLMYLGITATCDWLTVRNGSERKHLSHKSLPLMMGCGHHSAPVQEDLDDLVVVSVGREDQRGDVGGEGGCVGGQSLPALKIDNQSPVSFKSISDHEINQRVSVR